MHAVALFTSGILPFSLFFLRQGLRLPSFRKVWTTRRGFSFSLSPYGRRFPPLFFPSSRKGPFEVVWERIWERIVSPLSPLRPSPFHICDLDFFFSLFLSASVLAKWRSYGFPFPLFLPPLSFARCALIFFSCAATSWRSIIRSSPLLQDGVFFFFVYQQKSKKVILILPLPPPPILFERGDWSGFFSPFFCSN